jgi:ElaB/YqjD/DUF883 family membrane-anchored ribosome-binding protein
MDQRTDNLQQNIAETRHDIEETRASMTEKLELLEERVRDTLEETKTAVDDIVENVKGTVDETVGVVKETVTGAKSTMENIVENVKETMDDTVTKVKQSFDLRYQVEQHPWLMVGGSVVVGSILANLMYGGHETRPYSYYADSRLKGGYDAEDASATGVYTGAGLYTGTDEENATASQEHQKYTHPHAQRGWGNTLGQFQEEFDLAKGVVAGAVISTVMGTLQEMIRQNIPSMASHFDKVVNRVTKKWGAEPGESATNNKSMTRSGQAQSDGGSLPLQTP